jgi:hypothetical protein
MIKSGWHVINWNPVQEACTVPMSCEEMMVPPFAPKNTVAPMDVFSLTLDIISFGNPFLHEMMKEPPYLFLPIASDTTSGEEGSTKPESSQSDSFEKEEEMPEETTKKRERSLSPVRAKPREKKCKKKYKRKVLLSCKECSYTSYDKTNMRRHSNSKHTLIDVFQCPVCGYCSKQSGNVTSHAQREHQLAVFFGEKTRVKCFEIDKVVRKIRLGETYSKTPTDKKSFDLAAKNFILKSAV